MARIASTYYQLGTIEITNDMLCAEQEGTTPARIHRQTGIHTRYVVPAGTLPSDWATETANLFFEAHGINRDDIDQLIFCGEALDYKGPATACVIQHKLGLSKRCGAFDIPLGCSGFVYGLAVAKSLVDTGVAKNVLFITQEITSDVVHQQDMELRALFGDASACTLITQGTGIGQFVLGTDGGGEKSLRVARSALNNPATAAWLMENEPLGSDLYGKKDMSYGRMEMNGLEVFNFTMEVVPGLIAETLQKNNLAQDDVDLFVFHQANGFMLEVLRRKMGIPKEKFFTFLETMGNTASATIPVCLTEAGKKGLIQKGSKVLVAGFGIGFSWGATLIAFD